MKNSRLRIIVLGYIVRGPLGGLAWHHLQYVLGLSALGHDVYFLEDSDDYPACYDPSSGATGVSADYGLRFARDAFNSIGLGDRWAFHDAHRSVWQGPQAGQALNLCMSADLLLNVSGVNPIRPWFENIPVRALVDTDPVFTQVRNRTDETQRKRALAHNAYFTFAGNIDRPGCGVPSDGLPWRPTRQPIVMDAWPVAPLPSERRFTTVMQWESYPACVFEGARYGQKSESFAPYTNLPQRAATCVLELALGGPTAPRELLRASGWTLQNPLAVTRSLQTYQQYIRGSLAEFSLAKHGYVASRSGWFSERSAAYLASGRPVVVQDTGFSDWLTPGEGVLAFDSEEKALAGIDSVLRDPARHSRAAREVAAACFDANTVLTDLVEAATSASVLNDAARFPTWRG